jgi:hypothetical protein
MARTSPAEKQARIIKVTEAWSRMARKASFASMTLEQFKEAVKPSLDARKEIEELQMRLRAAIRQRNRADALSLELISYVGWGVKGDPNYGDDSALCEAMGYTRETRRIQNIRRARRRKRNRT